MSVGRAAGEISYPEDKHSEAMPTDESPLGDTEAEQLPWEGAGAEVTSPTDIVFTLIVSIYFAASAELWPLLRILVSSTFSSATVLY